MFYGMEVPVDTTSAKLQEFASKAERDAWIKEAVYKDLGVIRCATTPADWEQFDDFLKDFRNNKPLRQATEGAIGKT